MYQEIELAVTEGKPRLAAQLVQEALDAGLPAKEIMEKGLMPAMHQMGRDYNNSDYSIARILAGARAMKRALQVLEPQMENRTTKGKAIIGTAGGDLHDVGKNIVAIMFEGVGYEVVDLGVDVPPERFVQAIQENEDAQVVCISCLLTTSMPVMRHIVSALKKQQKKFTFRIMVGGAPITEEFAEEIGADIYTDSGIEAAEKAAEFLQ